MTSPEKLARGTPDVPSRHSMTPIAILFAMLLFMTGRDGNAAPSNTNASPSIENYIFASGFEDIHPVAISTGDFSACALMSDTTIRCWGDNSGGQLGNVFEELQGIGHAITVADDQGFPLTHAVAVRVGNYHACALFDDGSVDCWGSNFSGQMGLGSVDPYGTIYPPMQVPQLSSPGTSVLELALGKEHSCALLSSHAVKCWGLNQVEQAGQPNPTAPDIVYVTTPTQVDLGGATPSHISTGAYHSCSITSEGIVCWGLDSDGELGRTLPGNALWDMPGPSVPEVVNAQALASSASADHVCATLSDGTHQCWGRFESGQLGDGTSDYGALDEGRPTASFVLDDPGFQSLSVAGLNSCGIFNGAIYCWGDDSYEQLTLGAPQFSAVPFLTSITSGATDVAVGPGVVCAIVDGQGECWGVNDDGVLGRDLLCGIDPDPDACGSPTPKPVHGL